MHRPAKNCKAFNIKSANWYSEVSFNVHMVCKIGVLNASLDLLVTMAIRRIIENRYNE